MESRLKKFSLLAFLIYFALFGAVSTLYEDQIGKFDWRQQYIGKVTQVFFDKGSLGKKLIVGTDQSVIAILNGNSGKIQWRHLLGSNSKLHLLSPAENSRFVSVSGSPAVARIWDSATGVLVWETPLTQSETPEFFTWAVQEGFLYTVEISKDKNTEQYDLTIASYSLRARTEESREKLPAGWYTIGSKCELVFPTLVCLDEGSNMINTVNLKVGNNVRAMAPRDLGILSDVKELEFGVTRNTEASRFFWVRTAEKLHFLRIVDGLLSSAFSVGSDVTVFDVTSITEDNETKDYLASLKSKADGHTIEFLDLQKSEVVDSLSVKLTLPASVGKPDLASFYMFRKQQKELSFRFLASTRDHTLLCGILGDVSWTREESLASITAVEMVDFPVSETEASIEEEFSSGDGGVLSHVWKRMSSQFRQLRILARDLLTSGLVRGKPVENSATINTSVRDRFGLHKIIIVLTKPGKIFGMETTSGKIIWQKLLTDVSKVNEALYVQRTTAHYPLEPQVAVLASDLHGTSVLYVFNPVTGAPAEGNGLINLNFRVQQAMLLPQVEETDYLKPLLFLDESDQVHIFPDTPSTRNYVGKHDKSLFMYTTNRETCLMRGFSISGPSLEAVQVWQLQLCSGSSDSKEEITAIVSRRSDEKVFSQGRVLADRSVLYKYLNPNLVVVVVEGWSSTHRGYASIYLVDVVSGAVVFSTVHRRVSGPIRVAHAENWVVYSYYNEKFRRTEMASLELFEGKEQINATSFSSFSAPQPMIDRQAYIYPAYVTAITDTFTEKGMASKHLLVAIANGWIQELPRAFLDPRRPVVAAPTPEMREEGIIPYTPELPVPPEAIINYNQTVPYVRGIHTAPSALESTCLVLAYGLDVYFTRVTPSKTFDVLKDDFEYFFISTVVLGLFVASYIAKRMASKKSLKQAWK